MKFTADAYTLDAVVDAGVSPSIARTLLADGPNAKPERPRISTTKRGRAPLTTTYVWGPDANTLLGERRAS